MQSRGNRWMRQKRGEHKTKEPYRTGVEKRQTETRDTGREAEEQRGEEMRREHESTGKELRGEQRSL